MAFVWGSSRLSLHLSAFRKLKLVALALVISLGVYLLAQRHSRHQGAPWGNGDLLLALGRQGSARDVHGHRFKYLGIDGKWIPVSESPESALGGDADDGGGGDGGGGGGDGDGGGADDGEDVAGRYGGGAGGGEEDKGEHGYRLENPSRRDFSRGQSMVIDKLLNHQANGYFLDVGAGDGESNSITLFFEKWRHWSGLLLEPDEEKYEFILSKNRKADVWKTCVRSGNVTHFRGREPCIWITHVLDSLDRDAIDLLTINVRGQAYDIIQMIDLKHFRVKVISVEFEQDEERSVEYNQMTTHLLNWGYEVKHILIEKHLHKMDVIYMLS